VLRIGDAAYGLPIVADASGRAVARIVGVVAVYLVEHCIIGIAAERFFYGLEVRLVCIGGDLRIAINAFPAILHEVRRPTCRATANKV
jgi:hypothetical protein